jgi:hypothetical protein
MIYGNCSRLNKVLNSQGPHGLFKLWGFLLTEREDRMKDESLQAREWFLGELTEMAKRSGKPINLMGRAAWEQRSQEEGMPTETIEKTDETGE